MVYEYKIDGLTVRTGDIICTSPSTPETPLSLVLRTIVLFAPGAVKHVVVYVGPGGWCVEAGPGGVAAFEIRDHRWTRDTMVGRQSGLTGTLYGVAYPLADRGYRKGDETRIRANVASYCLAQARAGRPYNLNLLDSQTERAFYCSQLAYRAYLPHGINLNTEQGVPDIRPLRSIVFPQEIWSGCAHQRVASPPFGVDVRMC